MAAKESKEQIVYVLQFTWTVIDADEFTYLSVTNKRTGVVYFAIYCNRIDEYNGFGCYKNEMVNK